jgi:hypothetical protein
MNLYEPKNVQTLFTKQKEENYIMYLSNRNLAYDGSLLHNSVVVLLNVIMFVKLD